MLLKLDDPTMVYKLTLVVLTAPPPALMYIMARRFTTICIAASVMFLLFTSSYYSGYIMYARMLVASSFIILFMMAVTSEHKYRLLFIVLSVIAITLSHYTMALLFWIMLVLSSWLASFVHFESKGITYSKVIFVTSFSTLWVLFYYGWICRYTRVLQYTYTKLADQLEYIVGRSLPPYPLPYQVPEDQVAYHAPQLGEYVKPEAPKIQVVDNRPMPVKDKISLNPFANERSDFVLLKGIVLLRAGFMIAILISLFRKGEWRNSPLPYFITTSVLISLAGIWLPSASTVLGSIRPAYFSLLFELTGVVIWGGKQRQRYLLGIMLFLVACLPH